MAQPHVPKFGAWDRNSTNGPTYTAVFDEARAAKGGKMINPNDPAENPDLAAMYGDPASAPPQGSDERPAPRGRNNMANINNHEQDEAVGALVTRPRHVRRASREDPEVRRSSDALVARPGVGGRRAGILDRDGNNEGSGHTPERSPLHPRANRVGARESGQAGVGSEANPNTPRNARGRTPGVARVEEPTRRGSPLPEFGKWNTDPTAVEEYTKIFDQHKHEKKTGEAVQNRRSNPSPARNGNKSHKLGTSSKKDKCLRCTIL